MVDRRPPLSHLPDFTLADQFGRERDTAGYAGVPLIVVVGNREGAAGVGSWTAALRQLLGEPSVTQVLPVADLGGVPRLMRRLVRRMLPRDAAHWCALDWDGQLGAPIRGTGDPLVAAVYGADRALRMVTPLAVDAVDRATLVTLIERAALARD